MAKQMLRLRARGQALVTDYEAEDAGRRSYVGRKAVFDGADLVGFDVTDAVVEKPMRGEYLRALKKGDLFPADQATADLAGVDFDPTFGGAVKSAAKKAGDA
jgi:hypothetical protein